MRPRTYEDRVEIKVYLERKMREAIEGAVGHGNRSAFVIKALRLALEDPGPLDCSGYQCAFKEAMASNPDAIEREIDERVLLAERLERWAWWLRQRNLPLREALRRIADRRTGEEGAKV